MHRESPPRTKLQISKAQITWFGVSAGGTVPTPVTWANLIHDIRTHKLRIWGRKETQVRICVLIRQADQVKISSAIKVALLLLPETFDERDLHVTIAGISYLGDPRMSFGGDDPRKVQNVIEHQLGGLDYVSSVGFHPRMQQFVDPSVRGRIVRDFPIEELPHYTLDVRLAMDTGLRQEVHQAIQQTVGWPSFTQSIKSAVTAGVARSWRYAGGKRRKAALVIDPPVFTPSSWHNPFQTP
ncbi:Mmp37-domain-containing protein [Aspergillus neoniger CBS 115656]|uniref:Phosphatidate cytidylyltransferase, mitochondrial n=1 Tax=Aspergillus neoniger (strain CBS 115656) TaxID=1448310 RepID=A0A318ZH35_ASPNB|nr:Mmp37-domain-containing protein [Aspergillus neoniger CBS 115656]PYH35362.1 Mmp37-domain-containing protein [Aspergillus neoniger CBS 115656]